MSVATSRSAAATATRPFRVEVQEEQLADLRHRVGSMRWPSRELVTDRSQGVQLATIQELVRYWGTDYDWHRCAAKLNALPQFKTEIDGVDIHFIHVKSPHPEALPLIMTHGWPGSVVELLETVGPLPSRRRTAGAPKTRSTSSCRPSQGTVSRASRPKSAGTPGTLGKRGRN